MTGSFGAGALEVEPVAVTCLSAGWRLRNSELRDIGWEFGEGPVAGNSAVGGAMQSRITSWWVMPRVAHSFSHEDRKWFRVRDMPSRTWFDVFSPSSVGTLPNCPTTIPPNYLRADHLPIDLGRRRKMIVITTWYCEGILPMSKLSSSKWTSLEWRRQLNPMTIPLIRPSEGTVCYMWYILYIVTAIVLVGN